MNFNNGISLEKDLIQSIHGYAGYQKSEYREETDKKLREYLATEIGRIEKSFVNVHNNISKQGNQNIADSIDKLIYQLKNLIKTLTNPNYSNNSPFFNHTSVDSNMLSQLYHYDSQLIHNINILTEEVSELEEIEEISETNEFLDHLFDVVDNLNQMVMEREFLLSGGDGDNMEF